MKISKDNAKRFFRKSGVSIKLGKNARPLDLRKEKDLNPNRLGYLSNGNSYFISVPVEKIVHMEYMSFPLIGTNSSPFVRVLIDYTNGHKTYEGSILEDYYKFCTPKNVAEFMGIDHPENKNLIFLDAPHSPRLFSEDSLERTYELCLSRTIMENRREINKEMSLEFGRSLYGPTSKEKGEIEFSRLANTFEDIKSNGYKFDATGVDSISGVFLYNEMNEDWVVAINSGQHRVACMAALGYSDIMIHIIQKGRGGVLEASQSRNWAIVRRNILTPKEARDILLRKLSKSQPTFAKKWPRLSSGT